MQSFSVPPGKGSFSQTVLFGSYLVYFFPPILLGQGRRAEQNNRKSETKAIKVRKLCFLLVSGPPTKNKYF